MIWKKEDSLLLDDSPQSHALLAQRKSFLLSLQEEAHCPVDPAVQRGCPMRLQLLSLLELGEKT